MNFCRVTAACLVAAACFARCQEIYRALRAGGGEAGKRIKEVLQRLRDDPGKVRGASLRYRPDAVGFVISLSAS